MYGRPLGGPSSARSPADFLGAGLQDKPYVEFVGGELYIESAPEVRRCLKTWDALEAATLPPDESRAWLTKLME